MTDTLPVTRASNLAAAGFQHGFFGSGPGRGLHGIQRGSVSASRVAVSRGRIVRYLGIVPEALHRPCQVHGIGILEVGETGRRRHLASMEGDALIACRPGLAVGVLTADCAPLLVADPSTGWVGAAHLGRRGALAGLAGALVRRLMDRGASLRSMNFAIGPHIQADGYEVGETMFGDLPEVAQHRDDSGRACCNLRGIIAADLGRQGVRDAQVCWSQEDTLSNPGYFSHRRQGEDAGRQLTAIVAGGGCG